MYEKFGNFREGLFSPFRENKPSRNGEITLSLMLGLHYVTGSHGSHGSQKRSSPWCFYSFLSLCSSSAKSRYVFSRSLKVCRDRGSPARYGLSRMVLRFIPACHVLLGPLTFCYVAIKFCYAYQVLSRFSTIKRGRWMVFEPQYAHGIKRRSTKLLQAPLIKKHHYM